MKKLEKKLLWWRGAKFCLTALKHSDQDVKDEAQDLLKMPGMAQSLRDDYWVRGFVAMLKRKAGVQDAFYIPGQNRGI